VVYRIKVKDKSLLHVPSSEIISEMVLLRSEANEYAVSIRRTLPPIFPKSRRTGCTAAGTHEPDAEMASTPFN
jgi:hypothetical protein